MRPSGNDAVMKLCRQRWDDGVYKRTEGMGSSVFLLSFPPPYEDIEFKAPSWKQRWGP
jgi:hypothetical protein